MRLVGWPVTVRTAPPWRGWHEKVSVHWGSAKGTEPAPMGAWSDSRGHTRDGRLRLRLGTKLSGPMPGSPDSKVSFLPVRRLVRAGPKRHGPHENEATLEAHLLG
jgi:hypothetical protein